LNWSGEEVAGGRFGGRDNVLEALRIVRDLATEVAHGDEALLVPVDDLAVRGLES
jgi:hypothetical protein